MKSKRQSWSNSAHGEESRGLEAQGKTNLCRCWFFGKPSLLRGKTKQKEHQKEKEKSHTGHNREQKVMRATSDLPHL